MKKITTVLFITAIGSLSVFTACADDRDIAAPNEKVLATFKNQYPDTNFVEWEKEGSYFVAEFQIDGIEAEAWYDKGGRWISTEKEISVANLPEEVKTAFKHTGYATWKIEDCDQIIRPMDTLYLIEVENIKDKEVDLLFDKYGKLLEEKRDIRMPL